MPSPNFRTRESIQYNTGQYYSTEKNKQILIALLKQNNIRTIVVSPGATNVTLVGSLQHDSFFKLISCVDERAAAYMALGMAETTGEPIALSCTGATSSRNYYPALTEAYYKRLPLLVITSSLSSCNIGHLYPQVTDRIQVPFDIVKSSFTIQNIKDANDIWDCEIKINKAISDLTHDGGGPVHINLETTYDKRFTIKSLPYTRSIRKITYGDKMPSLKTGKTAIFIGSHKKFSPKTEHLISKFCEIHNAVVLCDHTSNYYGMYKLNMALIYAQERYISPHITFSTIIYLGGISGDYYSCSALFKSEMWRVSLDGDFCDRFKDLYYVFDMSEDLFFESYTDRSSGKNTSLYESMLKEYSSSLEKIPEMPFSNIWIAKQIFNKLPTNAQIHLGILNSLRSWNFFAIPQSVTSFCNVGGFGIDGVLSSAVGASCVNPHKLYFCILGDLSFFYDVNILLNSEIKNNIRILLINNGRGTEFRNYNHVAACLGASADAYVAAAGHFGNQSIQTVHDLCESLNIEYSSAKDKDEFLSTFNKFISQEPQERALLLEIFTNPDDESNALKMISSFMQETKASRIRSIKKIIKKLLGK